VNKKNHQGRNTINPERPATLLDRGEPNPCGVAVARTRGDARKELGEFWLRGPTTLRKGVKRETDK